MHKNKNSFVSGKKQHRVIITLIQEMAAALFRAYKLLRGMTPPFIYRSELKMLWQRHTYRCKEVRSKLKLLRTGCAENLPGRLPVGTVPAAGFVMFLCVIRDVLAGKRAKA